MEVRQKFSNETVFIAICGGAASGKTTICKSLNRTAIDVVSCGSKLRHFSDTLGFKLRDRESLQSFGISLLQDKELMFEFNSYLLRGVEANKVIVFDGPRLFDTIVFLRERSQFMLIYLDINNDIRRSRYYESERRGSFDDEEKFEIIMGRDKIYAHSDIIVKSSRGVEECHNMINGMT